MGVECNHSAVVTIEKDIRSFRYIISIYILIVVVGIITSLVMTPINIDQLVAFVFASLSLSGVLFLLLFNFVLKVFCLLSSSDIAILEVVRMSGGEKGGSTK